MTAGPPEDAGLRPRARLLRQRAQAGDLWIPVQGSSMGRSIRAGSDVLIEALDRAPRLGEVWAYVDAAGVLVVHRYLGRRGDALRFAGDAQRDDPPVEPSMLVGRAVRARRGAEVTSLGGARRARSTTVVVLRRAVRGLAIRLGARRLRRWLGRPRS